MKLKHKALTRTLSVLLMLVLLLSQFSMLSFAADSDFTKVTTLEDGGKYILSAEGYGLTGTEHTGYVNTGNYAYSGLAGTKLTTSGDTITAGADKALVLTAVSKSGGWAFKTEDGKYLNSSYGDNSSGAKSGKLYLGTSEETWTLDSSSKLKSNTSTKYFTWDATATINAASNPISTGSGDFFGVRSSGLAITLYKQGSGSTTPVTPNPETPSASGDFAKVTSLTDGGKYILSAEGYGLTGTAHTGYVNSSKYEYSGLAGTKLTTSGDAITAGADKALVLTAVSKSGGWAFKTEDGKYLNSSYGDNSNGAKTGKLYLGTSEEIWTLESGSKLKSNTSTKYFTWDATTTINASSAPISTGSGDFFGVRSSGLAITFYQQSSGSTTPGTTDPVTPPASDSENPTKVTGLTDGGKYILSAEGYGLTGTAHTGYINSSKYEYSGLAGTKLTTSGDAITAGADKALVLTAVSKSGGWVFKTEDGKYLNSSYGDNSNGAKTGKLYLGTSEEIWTLESGSKLKSNTSTKYFTWDATDTINASSAPISTGSGDFFGVRSSGLAVSFYQVTGTIPSAPSDDDTIYVAFTSDVHSGGSSANNFSSVTRLDTWLNDVSTTVGSDISVMGMCGDMASYYLSEANYWVQVQNVMNTVKNNSHVLNAVFTTGNHEIDAPGYYKTSSHVTTEIKNNFTRLGKADTGDTGVQMFAIGADSYQKFVDSDVAELEAYLKTVDMSKPVFIISHFPLHSQGSRNITGADKVISVLNNYPNAVFLWGHNHTDAASSEKHYDTVFTGKIDNTEIKFTYAAAGCMSDSEYSSGSAAVKGKGLVVGIDGDDTISLTYYNAGMSVINEYEVNIKTGKKVSTAAANEISGAITESASLVDGGKYIISAEGYGMTNVAHGGYTNTSSYSYSGYTGYELDIDGDSVIGGAKNSMLWIAEKSGDNWAFIDAASGQYLSATYDSSVSSGKGGKIYLSSEKTEWTVSGGKVYTKVTMADGSSKTIYLTWDSKTDTTSINSGNGSADLFTIRSSGDTITFYAVADSSILMRYKAATGGKVSIGSEAVADGASAKGATATASAGYTFKNWTDASGKVVGTNATYVPTVEGTYTANFTENANVTISYAAGSNGTVSPASESVAPATGTAKGATATANKGYEFANWTDASGKVVSTQETFVPEKTDGAYSAQTYTANFVTEVVGFRKTTEITDGWYVISADGMGMVNETHDGYHNNNQYIYSGFQGEALTVESDRITSDVPLEMMWKVTKTDGGYTIQNLEGLYLCSTYLNNGNTSSSKSGLLFVDSEPDVWVWNSNGTLTSKTSSKSLTWDTDTASLTSGSSSLFTIRSTGDKISFYKASPSVVTPDSGSFDEILYIAGENGKVSRSRELIVEGKAIKGAVATPNEGFNFVNWTDASGKEVSTSAEYVPAAKGTYTANFVEQDDIIITYSTVSKGSVSVAKEVIGPATGKALGSVATPAEGYHFLGWYDSEGNLVSDVASFVPKKSGNLWVSVTYTAYFEKDPECFCYESVAPANGSFVLSFDGTKAGTYTLTYYSDCWLIQDADGRYVAPNRSFTGVTMSESLYRWKYDGGFVDKTTEVDRYLTYANGKFAISSEPVDADVLVETAYAYHTMTYTEIGEKTHHETCSKCGVDRVVDHVYDEVGICGCGKTSKADNLRGDVNLDGKVDMMDVSILYRKLVGTYTGTFSEENADFNTDNSISLMDVSALYRYLAK